MDYVYCPICKRNTILMQPILTWILVTIPLAIALFCIYQAFNTNTLAAQVWSTFAVFLSMISLIILLVCRMVVEPKCRICGTRLSDLVIEPRISSSGSYANDVSQNPQSQESDAKFDTSVAPVSRMDRIVPPNCKVTAIGPETNSLPGRRIVSYSVCIDDNWYTPNEDHRIRVLVHPGKHKVSYKAVIADASNRTSVIFSDQSEIDVQRNCTIAVSGNGLPDRLFPYKLRDD